MASTLPDIIGFAAAQAIAAGELDAHLPTLELAISDRRAMTNRDQVPPKTAEMIDSGHQVWVWMQVGGPFGGQWEVRGTGYRPSPADGDS